jgi:hypothetical protein
MPLNPYDEINPPPVSQVGRVMRSFALLGSMLAGIGLVSRSSGTATSCGLTDGSC